MRAVLRVQQRAPRTAATLLLQMGLLLTPYRSIKPKRTVTASGGHVGGEGRRILRLKSLSPGQPPQGPTLQSNTPWELVSVASGATT